MQYRNIFASGIRKFVGRFACPKPSILGEVHKKGPEMVLQAFLDFQMTSLLLPSALAVVTTMPDPGKPSCTYPFNEKRKGAFNDVIKDTTQ